MNGFIKCKIHKIQDKFMCRKNLLSVGCNFLKYSTNFENYVNGRSC